MLFRLALKTNETLKRFRKYLNDKKRNRKSRCKKQT